MNVLEKVHSIEKEYGSVLNCPYDDIRLIELNQWWFENPDISLDDELTIQQMLKNRFSISQISRYLWLDVKEVYELAKRKGWI